MVESATAIIKDPSTIRSDRDKYYFDADEFFDCQSDVVKIFVSLESRVSSPASSGARAWRITDPSLTHYSLIIDCDYVSTRPLALHCFVVLFN